MDQGKSDLCAAEISITLFKKFASFRRVNIELSHIDSDIEKGHANIRQGVENAISFSFISLVRMRLALKIAVFSLHFMFLTENLYFSAS